ncbi:MAG TPA: hypothetical protein VGN61_16130, partial [Verrucomicrobiae bacterium]
FLAVEVHGDTIELRPTQPLGELKRVNGILVFAPPAALANEDYVSQSRDERIDDLMTGFKKD